MSRRFRRRPPLNDVPLKIAPAGGRDVAYPLISFDEYPEIEQALKASRTTGNAIVNPDFEIGTDGWTAACNARIASLIDEDAWRIFRSWGPRRYPDRKYDMPASVARGFAEHLETAPATPAGPMPFHVDVSRYSGRQGMAFDMRGLMDDIDAAGRAGHVVFHHMEGPAQVR